jgi:hypothetical protein
MHLVNLSLAAATVLFGSVAALRAEPLPASNATEITTRDLGPSPVIAPADPTPTPAIVPPSSPVAEIAVDPGMKGAPQPQEGKSDTVPHASHAVVPPHRPAIDRARLGCLSARPSVRVAKRAMPRRVAAPRAAEWRVASREPQCSPLLCSRYVVLGVGF